jgi:aspartate kinase
VTTAERTPALPGLVVQKYGGTSVGTPERIRAVADRIARTHQAGRPLVVVVSAMGDTTDELISLAHQVSKNPPHREMDMLLTVGERISMALLSMALADRKIPATSFTGSQTGIITNSSHRRARIRRILGDRVRSALQAGRVVIVAGFQGVSEDKEITTLGRGGSDTTAVALAAVLGAEACEIYTDVDGVYSADPRLVPEARLLSRIGHDQMVEMASRGAGVLHPRSVELAMRFGVPLVVRNSLGGSGIGTEVIRMQAMEEYQVTGVIADKGKMLVEIELARPTAVSAVWEVAAHYALNVVAPMFMDGHIRFFTDVESLDEWRKCLSRLTTEGFVSRYELKPEQVPLSVVGDRFAQDGAALQRVTETLAGSHISVTMGSASALAITVAVPRNHVDDGVRVLHAALIGK